MRTALIAVLLLAALPARAEAGELPDAVRRMAERAFLEGRLGDLDDILSAAEGPLDRLPLVLRDEWWRTTLPRPEKDVWKQETLTKRRWAWLMLASSDAWPVPESGGADPYPILTALIRDRVRRETRGHVGLPQDGPLKALATQLDQRREKRAIWFLDEGTSHMMSVAYRGTPPHREKVAADKEAEDLRARNGLLAVLALLAFLLVPALAAAVAFRQRAS